MAIALALVLVLVVIGSVLFHVLSPWWLTPIASNWGYIDGTVILTFWITGIGYIAIILFMAYCVFRFRHQAGRRAAYEPENTKLEWSLGIGTTVAVLAMLGPGLVVWYQYIAVPKGASEFEVVGQQWQWSFRLPGKDGRLGTTDASYISSDNPLGLNPNDPSGQDDVVIAGGDLHLVLGKPVKVLLRSIDVVHDFYVPEFRAKMDLMPGLVTYFWFTPTRTGTFEILCAAFCGVGHPQMRGSVVVENEDDYKGWLQKQHTFAELSGRAKNASLTQ
jgi:cytochrome c oxidase subunit II